ncbi:unnamed protein product [Ranitomeya imitator]|uniref:MADF domain-containing protein n=1 Tax=Ranitomeya imitator TaxID=111125 RepID=A0ABN9L2G2_9NEOB|nr:unnamed protein product [Ranitomeya imitator]
MLRKNPRGNAADYIPQHVTSFLRIFTCSNRKLQMKIRRRNRSKKCDKSAVKTATGFHCGFWNSAAEKSAVESAKCAHSLKMSANEQDCVWALLEMYRSLPCLWKIKSADYSNRYKKKDAYEKLVAIYKEHHPTETVDEHILWYYDLLAFTRDQEIPRPCQTVTSICAPSPEENLPESPDEHVPLQQRERPEGNDVQSHQSSRSPCLEDQTRPQRPSRKRKSTAVDLLAMANNILSKHAATQLSAFPTLVEERLNKLDVTQRSHAERLMFDVLNAAAAGKLSDTSMLNITERQPSSQFYLGPPPQEPMHSTPVRRPGPHHSQFWTPPAPPSFADFSQGPPTSTHQYSEMDTFYQNL